MASELPFCKDKAYCYYRQGIVAGGSCSLEIAPSDVVICHEEIIPAPSDEDGMRDSGACLYFAGKRQGTAQVTLRFTYPTCEAEEITFVLHVDQELKVTMTEE